MAISAQKKEKMKRAKRRERVAARSLNGLGWFMDAWQDTNARRYIETGDEQYLNQLPDYSQMRAHQEKTK